MRRLIAVAMLLALGAPGAEAAFAYSRTLTTDPTQAGSVDTANYALKVEVTLGAGKIQDASCYDVIFTSDAGGTTKIPWEMETCSSSTGALIAWVQVANLSVSTSVTLYMFYGDATISTAQNTGLVASTAVWDSNYRGVWHLPNGSSLTASDSTANGNNGTATSVTATAGQVDGAGAWNGSTSKIAVGLGSSLNITGNATISAWINPTSFGGGSAGRIVDKNNGSAGYLLTLNNSTATNALQWNSNGTAAMSNNNAVSTGSWQYVVAVYDGSNVRFYANGSAVGAPAFTTNPSSSSGIAGLIGSRPADNLRVFSGSIDEVRVSNVVRTPSTADWNSQKTGSTFLTIGSETALGGSAPVVRRIIARGGR